MPKAVRSAPHRRGLTVGPMRLETTRLALHEPYRRRLPAFKLEQKVIDECNDVQDEMHALLSECCRCYHTDSTHRQAEWTTGDDDAVMRFDPNEYVRDVVRGYGLALRGWPRGEHFQRPIDVAGRSKPQLARFLCRKWNAGQMWFDEATEQERRDGQLPGSVPVSCFEGERADAGSHHLRQKKRPMWEKAGCKSKAYIEDSDDEIQEFSEPEKPSVSAKEDVDEIRRFSDDETPRMREPAEEIEDNSDVSAPCPSTSRSCALNLSCSKSVAAENQAADARHIYGTYRSRSPSSIAAHASSSRKYILDHVPYTSLICGKIHIVANTVKRSPSREIDLAHTRTRRRFPSFSLCTSSRRGLISFSSIFQDSPPLF